ncbi:MAG TPA: S46 family peptidase, partial [Bacteroidales bacterium]|nr:S46 family peptidase [Bacteroidales bacterium]
PSTEQKLLARILEIYYKNIPAEYHPQTFNIIKKKYKNNFEEFAEDVFKHSILATEKNFNNFLNKPSLKKLENDLIYKISNELLTIYLNNNEKYAETKDKLNRARRLFVEGIREMDKDKTFYPDANSTMRVTYGKVADYYPADAIYYNYYTTLTGVMEKEDPTNEEFIVPAKLKELYQKKDFGIYQKDNDIPVCFITDNDITGGNSGSPVLNGDGQLIGIAFDGNWEAMSGNIAFEPELQRTINVDIRYVLFIIDKFANAQNIMKELTIIY